MKKLIYVVASFSLGVVVALSGSSAYAAVQSMIGKKVTAEMTVIVDGQELINKGAVIDGVTNVPVRAMSNSIGADISVEGKTIYINTKGEGEKQALLDEKEKLEKSIESTQKEYDNTKEKMEQSRIPGTDRYEGEQTWVNALEILDAKIKEKEGELDKINEALKNFE